MAPRFLRELVGRLQAFEMLINQVSGEIRGALAVAAERRATAEPLLDRALASLEWLNNVVQEITRRLDELKAL
jgi:hypothetical protein